MITSISVPNAFSDQALSVFSRELDQATKPEKALIVKESNGKSETLLIVLKKKRIRVKPGEALVIGR